MKKLTDIKLTQNQKYALYFGGAVVGTYIIIQIIKAIQKGGDKGENKGAGIKTQVVFTDKYLSGLPLGVDNLTWASKVPTKYLPSFDAIGLSKTDSVFKAKAERIQKLLNQRMEASYDGYPALVVDGQIGAETTKAMIKIAKDYGKLDELVPLKTKDDLEKWAVFFGIKNDSTTNEETNPFPWMGLK
jgi:hypothetical protein